MKNFAISSQGKFFYQTLALVLSLAFVLSACGGKQVRPTTQVNAARVSGTTPSTALPQPTEEITRPLRQGDGILNDTALSPDGNTLAAATSTGLYLYDALTLKQSQTLNDVPAEFNDVLFTPDSSQLVTSSQGRKVIEGYSMKGQQWQYSYSIQGEGFDNYHIAVSPDGKVLAKINTNEGDVAIHDLITGDEKANVQISDYEHHSAQSLSYTSDGKRLIIVHYMRVNGDIVYLVRVLDASTLKEILVTEVGDIFLDTFSISPEGHYMAVVSRFGGFSKPNEVAIVNLTTGKTTRIPNNTFRSDGNPRENVLVGGFAFNPDESVLAIAGLAIGGVGNSMCLWDVEKNSLIKCLDYIISPGSVENATFSPDGNQLFAYGVGAITRWDTTTWKKISTNITNDAQKIIPDPNQRYFLTIQNTAQPYGAEVVSLQIEKWDWYGKNLLPLVDTGNKINDVRYSTDGKILVAAGEKNISFWDTKNYDLLKSIEGEALFSQMWDKNLMLSVAKMKNSPWKDFTSSLEGSKDMAAVAMADGSIQVLSLPDGGLKYELKGHKNTVTSLYFTPSYMLISASSDNTCIWDLKDGSLKASFPIGESILTAQLDDPSTLRVMTAALEQQVWDVATTTKMDTKVNAVPAEGLPILVELGKYYFALGEKELVAYGQGSALLKIPLSASKKSFMRQHPTGDLLAVNTDQGLQLIDVKKIYAGVVVEDVLLDFVPVNIYSADFNPFTGNLVVSYDNVISKLAVVAIGPFSNPK
jgi:WD40 repeat protein